MSSWDKICRPKCEGGLGITKIQDINVALLTKLRWKLIVNPENVWVKIVSAKSLTKRNFLKVKKK